jgi:hypothetical protein
MSPDGEVGVAKPRRTDPLSVTELFRLGLEVLYIKGGGVGGGIRFVNRENVNVRNFRTNLTAFSQNKGTEL